MPGRGSHAQAIARKQSASEQCREHQLCESQCDIRSRNCLFSRTQDIPHIVGLAADPSCEVIVVADYSEQKMFAVAWPLCDEPGGAEVPAV